MMFRVRGSMASHLQGAFSELWASTTGEASNGKQFYPSTPSSAEPTVSYVAFGKRTVARSVRDGELHADFNCSERSIGLSWLHHTFADETIKRALIDKANAGVAVAILVPNDFSDNHSVRAASQYVYEELLKASVKIYEFQPTFIHTKLLIVDGRWSVIGSANMDNRSRKLNDEVVLGISDEAFATEMENTLPRISSDPKRSNEANGSIADGGSGRGNLRARVCPAILGGEKVFSELKNRCV